jgi:hypothetical protein
VVVDMVQPTWLNQHGGPNAGVGRAGVEVFE